MRVIALLNRAIGCESFQPLEETDLPAVPVVRLVHEPLHDERLWSLVARINLRRRSRSRSLPSSASLRRARDDHVRDPSRRLRHSAELATITFAILPVVCVTPQSWRRSRSRSLPSSASLRRARDDHVRDPSRRLRHSAELATITFAIPPVVCVTPQSSRRHVHH